MYNERLDFLMKMTDTGNSTLGRAISFDPSYISKIRRGVRDVPGNGGFTESVCEYFAKRIADVKISSSICDVINNGEPLPADEDKRIKIVFQWLTEDDPEGSSIIPRRSDPVRKSTSNDTKDIKLFYGNEGKREAALLFLGGILENSDKIKTLLLFSNEDMVWMYESSAFAAKWGTLLTGILRKGIVVKIIHTVQRNLNEMTEAVKKWMPLYVEGQIEPYYCPKLRDDIYRRSIFVAVDHSVMTSTSVGDLTEGMANMIFYDRNAVKAFEKEFNNYFALCKPLMKIRRNDLHKIIPSSMEKLLDGEDRICIAGAHPLFLTVPDKYILDAPSEVVSEFVKLRNRFTSMLQKGVRITESFPLVPEDKLEGGGMKIMIAPEYYIDYTPEVAKDHLKNVLDLMRSYDNYEAVISPAVFGRVQIISKEDGNTVLIAPVPMLFEISEKNMSSAVFEYIDRVPGVREKQRVTGRIEEYIKSKTNDV